MGDVTSITGHFPERWGKTEARYPGDKRPPFGVGNSLHVTHGAKSPRRVGEEAERVRLALAERMEFLGSDLFAPALERACREQAIANLLDEYIWAVVEGEVEVTPYGKAGREAPRSGVEAVPPHLWSERARASANAAKFFQDCGLDAIGFARLAKELGWAQQLSGQKITDLAAKGRELRRGSA